MKRLMMSPDEAEAKEDEIHEDELLRTYGADGPESLRANTAEALHFYLEQVGQFARSDDGTIFYFRYRTREWYVVTSKPGSPFSVFVSTWLRLNSRSRDTQAALDHLREDLRFRTALMHVELTTADGETFREPFKIARKKKKK
jgi:hypothetical protein